jgi:MATE family multidrug resistance protein
MGARLSIRFLHRLHMLDDTIAMTTTSPTGRRSALAREGPALARLAAPLVAGLVASTGMAVVDTVMLAPLGALPLAAVALGGSVSLVLYMALYGFVAPVGLFAGRHFGAGTPAGIGHVARHGALLALSGGAVAALLMAAGFWLLPRLGQPPEVLAILLPYWLCLSALLLPYALGLVAKNLLDAAGRPWTGVLLALLPVPLNVGLNWVLIYGNLGFPALGLTGAGIASLLATAIGAALLWAYARHAPALRAWWAPRRPDAAELRRQWREGLPMALQYTLEGGALAVIGLLVGQFGAVALAGHQIAQAVGNTLYMLPLGMAAAVGIRVAQVIGAGEGARVAAIGQAGLLVVSVWMGAFALLFLFAGGWIAGRFVDDPAVVAAAAGIFFVFGFTQLMDGVQSVSLGALRGMLDNAWPTRISLLAYWGIALPLSVLFGFGFELGAPGVWGGFGVGLAVAALALSWRFARLSRRMAGG